MDTTYHSNISVETLSLLDCDVRNFDFNHPIKNIFFDNIEYIRKLEEGRVRLNHVVAEYPTISWVGNKVRGYIPGFSQGPAPKSKEAEIWVKALKGEGELFVTADQAYVVTRILDAIYESNRTGKPVYFD